MKRFIKVAGAGVLAVSTLGLSGCIVGTVVGGMLIGGSDNYMRLFVVMGGFVILFEGPAGSGFDTTSYLARVDAQGRF